MPLAKLSSKSQIVLPAKIRRRLNIRPGDMLEITAKQGCVTIHKAPVSF
ncbi:MAG: AbrB/MazE/SpoVT family DNA-binding domain-containing protein, partial [Thermodesulfobacteriota bacterium]|nr:AbrB/MazE/SpoVT family DNA-binding domain-containing protein [Thermodesulfobacteriota bacterium]